MKIIVLTKNCSKPRFFAEQLKPEMILNFKNAI